MLFNSLHYLIFLPVVCVAYFSIRGVVSRKVFLLAASLYFYCVYSAPLCLLLLWSALANYAAARIIYTGRRESVRRAALICSVVANVGLLGFFKYYEFMRVTVGSAIGQSLLPALKVPLPLGISFYTFCMISYTVDVYRRELAATKSLGDLALYVSFFPHSVAGPIMRGGALLGQFSERHWVNLERISCGAFIIARGLAKKVFVADPAGRIADSVFGGLGSTAGVGQYSWVSLLLASYAFAVQIYCDFSGYSDIAVGSALMLGIRLARNFDAPYLSLSIREFWQRWHISLSTWLRDYVYIALGGNRGSRLRAYANVLITMLIGGLWHGANWTFVVWGLLQGIVVCGERATGATGGSGVVHGWWRRIGRWAITFHLICLGWIFFRCSTFGQAIQVVGRIVTLADGVNTGYAAAVYLCIVLALQAADARLDFDVFPLRHPLLARWAVYGVYVVVVVSLLIGSGSQEFLYFQF